jgi:hypothetical protein
MFKKNKYTVIRNVLNDEVLEVALNYLLIKRQCHDTLKNRFFISEYDDSSYGTRKDKQTFGVWSCYSDIFMETLLLKIKPIVEQKIKTKLFETYSYCRLYEMGSELKYHIDRESCEISVTLNIGGDSWPIFFEIPKTKKKIKVILNPGDLIIYRGSELYHWRDKFEKELCAQVFLHYIDINSEQLHEFKLDTRSHLGLPSYTKKDSTYIR